MDLEGHLPGHDAKTAAVAGGDETTMPKEIALIFGGTVTTHGAERRNLVATLSLDKKGFDTGDR